MQGIPQNAGRYEVWIAKEDGDCARPLEKTGSFVDLGEALLWAGRVLRGLGGSSLQAQNSRLVGEGYACNSIVVRDPDAATTFCTAISNASLTENDGTTSCSTPSQTVPMWEPDDPDIPVA